MTTFTSLSSIVIFVSLTFHLSFFSLHFSFILITHQPFLLEPPHTITIMVSIQNLPRPLSLPAIHAHWTAALLLPPTAQLSNLRRLVRAVTKDHHPALRPLSLAALSPLYLDLALAYAFLGEYYLASTVFKAAVENDAASAVGWFGLGLAQAELAEWRNARRSWKECLHCFESVGGRQEEIRYVLFQAKDEAVRDEAAEMLGIGLDSEAWTLERTRVEFNFRVALHEKGSKKLGVLPRAAGEERPGLNGLPAGLRFGPGWDASLQSLDTPPLSCYSLSCTEGLGDEAGFTCNPQPALQTPPSANTSRPGHKIPPHISSRKPLPAVPRSPPTLIPSLADDGNFNDHRPSLDEDPFTSSPENDTVDLFEASSQTLTIRPYSEYHQRLSQQSTLFTPEDSHFYDHVDEDDDESNDTSAAIDDTIASWSSVGQTDQDQTLVDQTQQEEQEQEQEDEGNVANETHEGSMQAHSELDSGEILLPRVFEGFGPPSQER